MNMHSEIAEKIVATYETHIDGLYGYPRFHWLVRLYRISGDKKYLKLIYDAFLVLKPKIIRNLGSLVSPGTVLQQSEKILLNYKTKNIRKFKRLEFYRKNMGVPVYIETLTYLFTVKSLGLETSPDLANLFNSGLDYYKKNDTSPVLLSPEFIRVYPSGAANLIYILDYLGISDNTKELLNVSQKYWESVTPESRDIWLDKIYALTHIVIAATGYYQKFVRRSDFEWIFDYFENNIDEIMDKCSTDAITEVGLCFKLIGEFDNRILGKIKDYLVLSFNEKLGFIAKKIDSTIASAEHRNILAVMVLRDFQKLYEGPYLRDYIV